jgi:hypothetical protein
MSTQIGWHMAHAIFYLTFCSRSICLAYNALSAWCIQIPGISKLQWHFFSGTSSPLDNTQRLSIIIKPLGGWTNNLRDQFLQSRNNAKSRSSAADNSSGEPATLPNNSTSCPFSFKARVEGPYGDESDFYLKYVIILIPKPDDLSPYRDRSLVYLHYGEAPFHRPNNF